MPDSDTANPAAHQPGFATTITFASAETVVLHVHGSLDLTTAGTVHEQALCLLRQCRRVVVDLSAVDFLSAAGLTALHAVHLAAQGARREALVVTGTRRAVVRPIAITGLAATLDTHRHLADALRPPVRGGGPR